MPKCCSCHNKSESSFMLSCNHSICNRCLQSYYPQTNKPSALRKLIPSISLICEQCGVMTIIPNNESRQIQNSKQNKMANRNQQDRENIKNSGSRALTILLCNDCMEIIPNVSQFLKSEHRTHDIKSAEQFFPTIFNALNKHYKSIDLQSQALYSNIQAINNEKRRVCDQYTHQCQKIRISFKTIHDQISKVEKNCMQKIERIMCEQINQYETYIDQMRKQTQKSVSYLSCINQRLQELHLASNNKLQYQHMIGCLQFYIDNDKIFKNYEVSLAQKRLNSHQSLSILLNNAEDIAPNLEIIQTMIRELRAVDLFQFSSRLQKSIPNTFNLPQIEPKSVIFNKTKISDNKKIFNARQDDNQIDAYFERKRQQLFSSRDNYNQRNQQSAGYKETSKKLKSTINNNYNDQNKNTLQKSKSSNNFMQQLANSLNFDNNLKSKQHGAFTVNGTCYDIQGRINNLRKQLNCGQLGSEYDKFAGRKNLKRSRQCY